ncbi:hypothetical protein GWI33_018898 [Rhynchophorus ferrugineus]|uniref:Uncharacterized protein n=1 Tax=Rhynchophorus ferrugineus TaxID=354439 RepID=A0A834M4P8_RHYFE|nr:hypothetical protein GWI33_018898 [Rhynchophorus ferrugineus]
MKSCRLTVPTNSYIVWCVVIDVFRKVTRDNGPLLPPLARSPVPTMGYMSQKWYVPSVKSSAWGKTDRGVESRNGIEGGNAPLISTVKLRTLGFGG